jgi:hypothetical protein
LTDRKRLHIVLGCGNGVFTAAAPPAHAPFISFAISEEFFILAHVKCLRERADGKQR